MAKKLQNWNLSAKIFSFQLSYKKIEMVYNSFFAI